MEIVSLHNTGGGLAQLGERKAGSLEVTGSIPVSSTNSFGCDISLADDLPGGDGPLKRSSFLHIYAMALAVAMAASAPSLAQDVFEVDMEEDGAGERLVHVVPIEDGSVELGGMVDTWLATKVKRKIDAAKDAGASLIIIEINTYGGMVSAAEQIASSIDSADPIPTVAYVKAKATSAGALIAVSCDKIYMNGGTTIGSAMPVIATQDGPQGVSKDYQEKINSHVRAAFRARAEKNGHNKGICEAMVDSDIELVQMRTRGGLDIVRREEFERLQGVVAIGEEGPQLVKVVIPKGKLLNFTAGEAAEYNFSSGTVEGREGLLVALGYQGATVVDSISPPMENAARIISGPMVTALALSVATLALLGALFRQSPSMAFVSLFAFGLFFWSKLFGGSASSIEVALFVIGFIALAAEVFVIPGFGVFGITGLFLIVGSLILSCLPPGFFSFGGFGDGGAAAPVIVEYRWDIFVYGAGPVMISFLLGAVGIALMMRYAEHVPLFGRVSTTEEIAPALPSAAPGEKRAAAPSSVAVGQGGVARTDLKPGGKVDFDGETMMVVADGAFIEAGTLVKVTELKGSTIVVDRA